MASLVKIGSLFLNLDQVIRVNDLLAQVQGGQDGGPPQLGRRAPDAPGNEADGLRTWLNAVAPTSTPGRGPRAGGW